MHAATFGPEFMLQVVIHSCLSLRKTIGSLMFRKPTWGSMVVYSGNHDWAITSALHMRCILLQCCYTLHVNTTVLHVSTAVLAVDVSGHW